MILFHGTNKEDGEKILEDGFLKHDCDRYWKNSCIDNTNTTNGFVYLTDLLAAAAYRGMIKCVDDEDSFYIFSVDVPETELLPDHDEVKVKEGFGITVQDQTALGLLKQLHTTRVDKDYRIKEYVKVDAQDNPEIRRLTLSVVRGRKPERLNEVQKKNLDEAIEKFKAHYPFIEYI